MRFCVVNSLRSEKRLKHVGIFRSCGRSSSWRRTCVAIWTGSCRLRTLMSLMRMETDVSPHMLLAFRFYVFYSLIHPNILVDRISVHKLSPMHMIASLYFLQTYFDLLLSLSGMTLHDLADKKRGKFSWFTHSNETHGTANQREPFQPSTPPTC